eukprot:1161549-Pelagomonas_calceolata.AAC.12
MDCAEAQPLKLQSVHFHMLLFPRCTHRIAFSFICEVHFTAYRVFLIFLLIGVWGAQPLSFLCRAMECAVDVHDGAMECAVDVYDGANKWMYMMESWNVRWM